MSVGYFNNIPNIFYDFKSDGKYQSAKDMFRKVSTWSHLREAIVGYEFYRINEGERPDVIADRVYGDSTLYWLFFLVNDNLQDLNDWPKSSPLLTRYINRKYSGKALVASDTTDIVSYNYTTNISSKFLLGERVQQSSTVYGFVTKVEPTFNRIIVNSTVGSFTADSTLTTVRSTSGNTVTEKTFDIANVTYEKDAVHHYTDSNSLKTTVSTDNTVVTNEKYELDINEEKSIIRYIQPKYASRVVSEFSELMRI